jgi:DnaK suppressor protein
MKALELTKFRKVLVAKEAELSRALSRGAHHPTGEEAVTLELKSEMLEDVRDALRRLDEGTFGVCMGCGRNIKPRRLAAVPWALYCIQCQESIET